MITPTPSAPSEAATTARGVIPNEESIVPDDTANPETVMAIVTPSNTEAVGAKQATVRGDFSIDVMGRIRWTTPAGRIDGPAPARLFRDG